MRAIGEAIVTPAPEPAVIRDAIAGRLRRPA
jgi:hypothetical protein